jgi:hypothetical protein
MAGASMNDLIRGTAGRAPDDQLEPAAEQPVGSIGIGRGASAQPSRSDPADAINAQLRLAWAAMRGRVPIDALNW